MINFVKKNVHSKKHSHTQSFIMYVFFHKISFCQFVCFLVQCAYNDTIFNYTHIENVINLSKKGKRPNLYNKKILVLDTQTL